MNQDPAPEIMNQQPEPPAATGRPAKPEETGKKKPGFLQRLLGVVRWFDRGLDLEGRDTSDWNIYYYYFRQVAQHRSPIKLKYLKWFALAFQLYFFGSIVFAIINAILALDAMKPGEGEGFGAIASFAFIGMALLGLSSNLFILPFLLFLPVLVVAPAFRLRSKNRALMTSRAKEPPLLAHLVQYTSHKGLVQGALQSLLYTWKRLLILLSPCLVISLLILVNTIIANFTSEHYSSRVFHLAAGVPVCAVLFVLSASLFFLMQPFCYRLDSLMVAFCIGIETVVFVGITASGAPEDFRVFFPIYLVTCLFGVVYFPLAAADTGELGLGKRITRWLRILLYTMAGVFLAIMVLAKSVPALQAKITIMQGSHYGNLAETVSLFITLGLFVCISGLLVTSLSTTSPLAQRQIQTRTKESFQRKLFDPASTLSPLPVLALELISLSTIFLFLHPFTDTGDIGMLILYSWGSRARTVWTAIHFGLAFSYTCQRRKLELKAPWDFHVRFNMICIISYVAIQLLMALASVKGAGFLGLVLYIVSFIVLFTSIGWLKSTASTYKVELPPEAQEQDKEAS